MCHPLGLELALDLLRLRPRRVGRVQSGLSRGSGGLSGGLEVPLPCLVVNNALFPCLDLLQVLFEL
jgi:hypothetical protein